MKNWKVSFEQLRLEPKAWETLILTLILEEKYCYTDLMHEKTMANPKGVKK
ncbi:hypothetical protein QEG73_15055 [Chitinophagaceae bacterium 26-R-25]|nr:hypothetical protein [Chitinophagaceae bacterium 26-R-25]